ncbi:hypothetical protein QJQ45_019535 [Haematococcus lacustris]|nr:hypothetical protein QJQ45_019535 [Haematococcus lacustris]
MGACVAQDAHFEDLKHPELPAPAATNTTAIHNDLPARHNQLFDTGMQAIYVDMQARKRHVAQLYYHLPALTVAAWYDQLAVTKMQAFDADMEADMEGNAAKPYHHLPALTVIPNTL